MCADLLQAAVLYDTAAVYVWLQRYCWDRTISYLHFSVIVSICTAVLQKQAVGYRIILVLFCRLLTTCIVRLCTYCTRVDSVRAVQTAKYQYVCML